MTTESTTEPSVTETTPEATTTTATENSETSEGTEVEAGEGTVLGGEGEATPEGDGEGTGGEGEGKEEDSPAGAPEAYELTLKDADGNDISLDAEMVSEADPVLRELNLSNEQANKLLPLAVKMQAKGLEAATQQLLDAGAQQKKDWLEEFKASDIGGAKAEQTASRAATALEALGFPKGHEFRKLLDDTGFGNNVHFINAFAKVGEMVGEDNTFPVPNEAGGDKQVGWSDRYKTD